MSYVVVTGANGFIGTNVVEAFLSIAPEDLGVQDGSSPKPPRFSSFGERPYRTGVDVIGSDLPESLARPAASRFAGSVRYSYIPHDQLVDHLRSLAEPPLVVVHNGACSSTVETNPEIFARLNVGSSQTLWQYCAEYGVPFLYASSAATYGDGTQGFSDKKEDCHLYTALNLYGKSKLDFDLWALEQAIAPPVWFGLRYFNVYGPYESHKGGQASMVYHGYHQALKTGSIKLFESNSPQYGHGEQERDFIYVEDVVDVTLKLTKWALFHKQNNPIAGKGCFVNVGRGKPETWNTLARSVFAALELPARIEYIPIPDSIKRQYQNYTCADLSTLHRILGEGGYLPLSFEEGIQRYIKRHLMRGGV